MNLAMIARSGASTCEEASAIEARSSARNHHD
jgi:hypothetical protein